LAQQCHNTGVEIYRSEQKALINLRLSSCAAMFLKNGGVLLGQQELFV
jgi:hypothetical protein